jgi:DNA modification methylase
VECDDETAMRILLADNRTAEKAEREPEPLADLLQELEQTDDGLEGTGYMGDDLDELLDDLGRIPGGEDVDDLGAETSRAEELQEKWGTERGQLWQIGRHRLLCGDSTDESDVERLLDGAEPNLMVTDPPYGVEYDADWRSSLDSIDRATGRVQNDDRASWVDAWALAPSVVAYCWHADRHASTVQVELEKADYSIRSQIVWVKPHFALSRGHYHWQHEPCWYAVREGENASWIAGRDQSTVWEVNNGTFQGNRRGEDASTGHGTQKPVECMQRPIRNHKGDVYEPFCGSGTSIIAAEQEGRTCHAMEIDPGYCAVILERCSEAGLECELIS